MTAKAALRAAAQAEWGSFRVTTPTGWFNEP